MKSPGNPGNRLLDLHEGKLILIICALLYSPRQIQFPGFKRSNVEAWTGRWKKHALSI